MSKKIDWIQIKNEKDKDVALEQYKMIVDILGKANDHREFANNFWITINALIISGVAYLRDTQGEINNFKNYFLISLLGIGIALCGVWISSLNALKELTESREEMLRDIEEFLPIKVFSHLKHTPNSNIKLHALTVRQKLIPLTILVGYLIFLGMLVLYSSLFLKI